MKSFKQLKEELQLSERYDKDLDVNKNGKLDSDDFKQLKAKKKSKECDSDCNESSNEEYELDEAIELELSEISAGLAYKVGSARSKQASNAWYKTYNPENPEYKTAKNKADKAMSIFTQKHKKELAAKFQKQKDDYAKLSPEEKKEKERKAMYGGDTNNPRGLGS